MNVEQGFSQRGAELVDQPVAAEAPLYRQRWLWIAGAVIIVVALALLVMSRRGGIDAKAGVQALPHVTVIVPGHQSVANMISATGSLAARREMPVGVAGEGGMVSRVLVEPGDWVAAGQTLATIDRSVQQQESNGLAASIDVARADAALAQSDLDRAQSLVARGFISKADIDKKISTRDAANARVKVAQAQLGETRAKIGRLDIRAPAAGLVLTRTLEPGQIVGPSGSAMFRIAKDGQMEMLARLAEQDLARLRVGTPAKVTPTGSATSFAGQIWQLSPVIDASSRQGTARIALAYNPAIRPGGFAAAQIMSGAVDAPLLPESAVQSDEKGNFVYVIDKDDRVVRRTVKVGNVSDQGIAIASGLAGNERIVLSAAAFLNPGDKVVPTRQAAQN